MINPYRKVGETLELAPVSGAGPTLVMLGPPLPPIRQLPLPVVLFPFMKKVISNG